MGHKNVSGVSIRSAGNNVRGGEVWEIVDPSTGTKRLVLTSPASVAALDEIVATHAETLKRLADK